MTTQVKLFCYAGLVSAPVVSGTRQSFDSVMMFKNPYLGSQALSSADTSTAATSSAVSAPSGTEIALIQVQNGKRVGYEVTTGPEATLRVATSSSPTLAGDATVQFGPGWRISVIELT